VLEEYKNENLEKYKNEILEEKLKEIEFLKSLKIIPENLNLKGTKKIIAGLERDEMYNFLKDHSYEEFIEDRDVLKAIMISWPVNLEGSQRRLLSSRPSEDFIIQGEKEDAEITFQFNQISEWFHIELALGLIIGRCSEWGFKDMKIRISFSILIEYHNMSGFGGFYTTENGQFIKYALSIGAHSEVKTIPFHFEMSKMEMGTRGLLDYIHKEIQSMIDFTHNSSNTIYIAITGISFRLFLLSNIRMVLRKY
jgi:hypothetical protein